MAGHQVGVADLAGVGALVKPRCLASILLSRTLPQKRLIGDGQADWLPVNVLLVLFVVAADGHFVELAQVVLHAGIAVRHPTAADVAFVDVGGRDHVSELSDGILVAGIPRKLGSVSALTFLPRDKNQRIKR